MGFFEENLADGSVRRGETFTCAHCNNVEEFRDNRGMFKPPTMCAQEHKPICERCAVEANQAGKCLVFEKTLEKIEARDRMLRSIGLIE
jgi:hypothetical protein